MKNEKGFSLVELLIVVAIIANIAAIAVPSLLTARMAANEASSLQGLRTIGSAEIAIAATQNQQYTHLTSLVAGNYLDSRFTGTGYINGYTYSADCAATVSGAPIKIGRASCRERVEISEDACVLTKKRRTN